MIILATKIKEIGQLWPKSWYFAYCTKCTKAWTIKCLEICSSYILKIKEISAEPEDLFCNHD